MSDLNIIQTCPLGNACEEVKDNSIYRCQWYQEVIGNDPQTGDRMSKRKCAIVLNNSLQIEISKQLRGLQSATESFRNEMVSGTKGLIELAYKSQKNNGR